MVPLKPIRSTHSELAHDLYYITNGLDVPKDWPRTENRLLRSQLVTNIPSHGISQTYRTAQLYTGYSYSPHKLDQQNCLYDVAFGVRSWVIRGLG